MEQQKLNAQSQFEILMQRLSGILGSSSADTIVLSIEDMTNRVCYFLFTRLHNYYNESYRSVVRVIGSAWIPIY